MAIINRLYSETPDYTASYDYDDQALKLIAIHVDNGMPGDLTIGIFDAATDALLDTEVFPPGHTDRTLRNPQQHAVTLDARGRVTNLYAKSIS